jgi:hypothetical protein
MFISNKASLYAAGTPRLSLAGCQSQLLPDRFGSISEPNPGAIVDFGQESSIPVDFASAKSTESIELIGVASEE